jgi:NodT family efflux transporter outer membrane factor (OMF) lipoprotein
MGAGPDRGLSISRPSANARAFGLPANLQADLIGRRPDIVAARLRAEAASQRIKVAKADFYPNINLSAVIGLQSFGLDMLNRSGSTYGSVGPAISLPIFSGGRLEGAYRGARADYDGAVAAYDATLTRALNDVADVAVSQRALAERLAQSRLALAASEDAYRLAAARYRAGLSTYLDVLSAEDDLTANRRAVADLETRAFALDVALVRALGGGFHSPLA